MSTEESPFDDRGLFGTVTISELKENKAKV